ncbi:MAG: hypothetical protein ACLP8B_22395 [Xanthobacteraceae bacterium]
MSRSIAGKATERKIISDLKVSASLLGKLYPVLIDKRGRIIDGKHRLKADPNWFKVMVPGVESDEHLLLLRLVSNVCRRNVPSSEKTEMLDELGQLYLEEGVPRNELVKKIVQKTGMSYRWVMKYASDELKVRPGFGGPKNQKSIYDDKIVDLRPIQDELLSPVTERVAKISSYSNTNFATILVEKRFYLKLEETVHKLGISMDIVINNALILTFQKMNHLAKNDAAIPIPRAEK